MVSRLTLLKVAGFFARGRLVKIHLLHYPLSMSLKNHLAWLVPVLCAAQFASADTIQLKDKAAVTGKILAEKSDAVVVGCRLHRADHPENAVEKISKAGEVLTPATSIQPSRC